MFTEIQVYCKKQNCCFDDIKNSKRPKYIINTEHISSHGPKETWGFCDDNEKYPYRILKMTNNDKFYCMLEDGDNLEKLLLGQNV